MKPHEHLERAEGFLNTVTFAECNTIAERIALAQALVDLATAQMLGRQRA